MKQPFLPLLLLLYLANHSALLAEKVEVPDDLRFITEEDQSMRPEEKAAWYRQLRETPGITDRLCELMWADYHNPSGLWPFVGGALMQRNDISTSQLKKITDEMRRLAESGSVSKLDHDKRTFLWGVRILERYPTAEHEDLALLLLSSDDSILRTNAATTLGRIGTERSVEPIRKFFDPFRHIKTEPPNDGKQVFEAEQMLLARVAAKSTSPAIQQGANLPKRPTSQLSSKPATPSEGEAPATPWGIIVVLFVAALVLLWLLLKRHS